MPISLVQLANPVRFGPLRLNDHDGQSHAAYQNKGIQGEAPSWVTASPITTWARSPTWTLQCP